MPVHNASVHLISKMTKSKEAVVQHPEAALEIDHRLEALQEQIARTYAKRAMRNGVFQEDLDVYPFSGWIQEFREGKSFLGFATRSANLLKSKMEGAFLSVGGHLLFCHYSHANSEFLLVAKLQRTQGSLFNKTLTQVTEAEYLDLDDLQMAARVNLSRWDAKEPNYVTFVHRREQDDPSQYFVEFLGCVEPNQPKAETNRLVQVVRDYCAKKVKDPDAAQATYRRVYDHLKERSRTQAPVELRTISNIVDPEHPDAFMEHLNAHDSAPTDGFIAHATTARKLVRYHYVSKDISLSMSREFFSAHGKVVTVDNKHQLIIDDIPAALRDELKT